MEKITRGGSELRTVEVPNRLNLRVRARRMQVRWRTLADEPTAMAAFDEVAPSRRPRWQEAIDVHELEEVEVLQVESLTDERMSEPMDEPALVMPGSPDTYVEVRATPIEPGDGLLLMVETEGVVQWYLPRNPAEQAMTQMMLLDAPRAPI